jgi:hypothetical protein
VHWTALAHDTKKWRFLESTVMNLLVSRSAGSFSTMCGNVHS